MAINANVLPRRPSDRNFFLLAAVMFPLLVLIGYFRTYYFSAFFDVPSVANALVHAHGIVMTIWVLYFVAQIALVRTKNIKLHITMGFAGIALAALVVFTGLLTAYDAHIVRRSAPPNIDPHSFLIVPLADMILFVIFFAGAIYYRKRPAEHKTLMLLTAFNFLPAAVGRIPVVPEQFFILWTFGVPDLLALVCLVWHSKKHGKLNKIFAAGVFLLIISHPLRVFIAFTDTWLQLVGWFAS